jgi:hypothetical protein
MKRSGLWLCMFGIVLWAGAVAPAQEQGQGRGGAAGQVRDRASRAAGAQNKAPAAADANAIEKARTARRDANAVGGAAAKRGQAEEGVAKIRAQAGQRGETLRKQLQQMNAQHLERQARLARLKELAEKSGNKETIARVDKLIAQEKQVFERKLNKVDEQPRSTAPAGKDAREQKTPDTKSDKK